MIQVIKILPYDIILYLFDKVSAFAAEARKLNINRIILHIYTRQKMYNVLILSLHVYKWYLIF